MALDTNWFKVHREMVLSTIWSKSTPIQSKVLITLMSMVNFKERVYEFNGNPIVIQKGQVITSLQEIADRCGKGITINNVRSALRRFEKLGYVTRESTQQGSLITVSKYEEYESNILKGYKSNNIQSANQVQAEHKSDTTNKKLKKERIEKREKETPPELKIEEMLKEFYYDKSVNRLESLILETDYTGEKEKNPLIMKKFSCYYFSKHGKILSFVQTNAAFKLWLINERAFENPIDKKGSLENGRINLSKLLNK